MGILHVFLVFLQIAAYLQAVEALFVVLLEGSGNLRGFFADFDDCIWVVLFGCYMLVEGAGGGEGFPTFGGRYLHSLHWNLASC